MKEPSSTEEYSIVVDEVVFDIDGLAYGQMAVDFGDQNLQVELNLPTLLNVEFPTLQEVEGEQLDLLDTLEVLSKPEQEPERKRPRKRKVECELYGSADDAEKAS